MLLYFSSLFCLDWLIAKFLDFDGKTLKSLLKAIKKMFYELLRIYFFLMVFSKKNILKLKNWNSVYNKYYNMHYRLGYFVPDFARL